MKPTVCTKESLYACKSLIAVGAQWNLSLEKVNIFQPSVLPFVVFCTAALHHFLLLSEPAFCLWTHFNKPVTDGLITSITTTTSSNDIVVSSLSCNFLFIELNFLQFTMINSAVELRLFSETVPIYSHIFLSFFPHILYWMFSYYILELYVHSCSYYTPRFKATLD